MSDCILNLTVLYRTDLGKCTDRYDETQGTVRHKRFQQKVFVNCKKIDNTVLCTLLDPMLYFELNKILDLQQQQQQQKSCPVHICENWVSHECLPTSLFPPFISKTKLPFTARTLHLARHEVYDKTRGNCWLSSFE